MRRAPLVLAVTAAALALGSTTASAALTQIGSDPFGNGDSQHRTAVEPDTFAFGGTIVAATQLGRYFDGGSSGIGFARSGDNGATWTTGILPSLTNNDSGNPGTFDRATDPAVAYDAKHAVWLVNTLGLTETLSGPSGTGVLVSRSTDGGQTFGAPVTVAAPGRTGDFDKTWIGCDNTPTSRFYGNCYATWDDFGHGDALRISTSSDGGLTWGRAKAPGGSAGLGGQPLVQPNGTVIVPFMSASGSAIGSFRSTSGGQKWSSPVLVSSVSMHAPAGSLRADALPSAEIDGAGNVFVSWSDCRFRSPGCAANDIVFSTSSDGVNWGAVTRVPIDPTNSGVDHFIPGLGVDPSTSGATARLGLTYYFYPTAGCDPSCTLDVGYVQSNDAGQTWSSPATLAGPFSVTSIADTSQGRMVGDYISTSWSGGNAWPAISVANSAPSGGVFDQNLYTWAGGLNAGAGPFAAAAVDTAAGNTSNGANGFGSGEAVIRSQR